MSDDPEIKSKSKSKSERNNNDGDNEPSNLKTIDEINNNDGVMELMGPILRRKKVVSMPLGASSIHRNDFFYGAGAGSGRTRQHSTGVISTVAATVSPKRRQVTPPNGSARLTSASKSKNKKSDSFVRGLIRRKQMSLDLISPQEVDFFFAREEDEEKEEVDEIMKEEKEIKEYDEETPFPSISVTEKKSIPKKKPFKPLVFSNPVKTGKRQKGGHEHGKHDQHDDEQMKDYCQALKEQRAHNAAVKAQLDSVREKILSIGSGSKDHSDPASALLRVNEEMIDISKRLEFEQAKLGEVHEEDDEEKDDEGKDNGILRATKKDYVLTGILCCIMIALVGVIAGWTTHEEGGNHVIYGEVGLACISPCQGDVDFKDFFHGENRFGANDVILVSSYVDPIHGRSHTDIGTVTDDAQHSDRNVHMIVDIVGADSGTVKKSLQFGPIDTEDRKHYQEKITINASDSEQHVIQVKSSDPNVTLSFTLSADVQSPLSQHSVIVAALIMVIVYFFILIEVVHRTLVAIFGSLVSLFFFFLMRQGHTETIRAVMLHMDWSTLGLLFGMMLIVGELSHTGIFEWCAVRLLVASNGSFNRLILLLGFLTALSSAFLDNVTTMLLIAPVTIDMCNILNVDPRPYLIAEVILSNIGGTATLIGDPPNIIIGSAFDEIGFVDFIIYVAPCIFIFCIPASLAMMVWIYKPYLSREKMCDLDTKTLKNTYPVYDEPRLLIAGTVTFFVILSFFLHPVHHKDTAWIALLGAFITMAFTNPHDIQDALRNHIEWDTLLFFAGLFVLVETCAAMGLLRYIGDILASYIQSKSEDSQLAIAITLILWVSAFASAFLDNIPYTATMIPILRILADELPDTLDIKTLAWALSFGACLGGNGTLLGASANIVTAGISANRGFNISFLNFLYPGMLVMVITIAISNIYMLSVFVWI